MKLGQLLDMLCSSKTIRIVDIDDEPIADYTRKDWRIRAKLEKRFETSDRTNNIFNLDVIGIDARDDKVEVMIDLW